MKARIPNQGGQANMMKKLQQMQDDMARVQKECEEAQYSASSGGGAVEVVLSGKKTMKSLTLKPEVVDPEDIEMLQDLIISAVNEAVNNIEKTTEEEMNKITGGVALPGLF